MAAFATLLGKRPVFSNVSSLANVVAFSCFASLPIFIKFPNQRVTVPVLLPKVPVPEPTEPVPGPGTTLFGIRLRLSTYLRMAGSPGTVTVI